MKIKIFVCECFLISVFLVKERLLKSNSQQVLHHASKFHRQIKLGKSFPVEQNPVCRKTIMDKFHKTSKVPEEVGNCNARSNNNN